VEGTRARVAGLEGGIVLRRGRGKPGRPITRSATWHRSDVCHTEGRRRTARGAPLLVTGKVGFRLDGPKRRCQKEKTARLGK
jgi:hypothetical protein